MFSAPFVLAGKSRDAWLKLPNDACRAFIQLFLHITSDRAHPYWSIRPLTVSHLAELWPGRGPGSSHAIRAAIEDELLWRWKRNLPDVKELPLRDHDHHRESGRCSECGRVRKGVAEHGCSECGKILENLAQNGGVKPDRLVYLIEIALANNDVKEIIGPSLPALISELVAHGKAARYLHQIAMEFVLHGVGSTSSFIDRVHEFLHCTRRS